MAGVHGKVFNPGDIETGESLVALGGFIPDYFKPVGSVGVDDPKELAEIRNWLLAKGVSYDGTAGLEALRKRRDEVHEAEIKRRNTYSDGAFSLSVKRPQVGIDPFG